MEFETKWKLRKFLALSVGSLIITAYIACMIIAATTDVYIGGLKFPYFSDTGREKPGYFIFASFITLAAVFMLVFSVLQYQYLKAWTTEYSCNNIFASACLFLSSFGAAAAGIVSSNENEDVHFYGAIIFFVLVVIYVGLSFLQYRHLMWRFDEFAKSRNSRNVIFFCLVIFFLLYIPIGLAVNCSFEYLSYSDCILVEDLGVSYCDSVQDPDDPSETVLYDYSDCVSTNHLRSVSQFLTLMSLMAWIILQAFDPVPPV